MEPGNFFEEGRGEKLPPISMGPLHSTVEGRSLTHFFLIFDVKNTYVFLYTFKCQI